MTLLERNPNAPSAWHSDLPVANRYTAGLAGERFLRAIKDEGRLLGTRCPTCNQTYVPGVLFCERDLTQLDEWVDVGTRGVVHTFTWLYENMDGSPRDEPQLVAFIKIADGGLVHLLGEIDPGEVEIGLPVEAVFKPQSERQGSILDILYFKPR